MRLRDLETKLVIDATLAVLQTKNFKEDLKRLLARLDVEPISEVQ